MRSGLKSIAVPSALGLEVTADERRGSEDIAVFFRGIDVSSLLEKDLDDIEVTAVRSGLESIAVPSALGLDVGALLEKDLDNTEVASC